MTAKNHGFQHPVPEKVPATYEPYCYFEYPAIDKNGKDLGGTVRSLFPPDMRNDLYGGKTETEIRSLAFDRLSELQKQYGSTNVRVIMEVSS